MHSSGVIYGFCNITVEFSCERDSQNVIYYFILYRKGTIFDLCSVDFLNNIYVLIFIKIKLSEIKEKESYPTHFIRLLQT